VKLTSQVSYKQTNIKQFWKPMFAVKQSKS